ncbi:hypothetical protein Tco_0927728, partial [Tanacetum coccineum]
IDKSVIPLSLMWLTASSMRQDPPSSVNQFDVEECQILSSNPLSFKKLLELFLCMSGLSHMDLSAYVKHSCGPFGHPCCSGYTARTRCYFRCPETADIVLVVDEENNVVAGGSRGVKRKVTRSPPNHPPKKLLAEIDLCFAASSKEGLVPTNFGRGRKSLEIIQRACGQSRDELIGGCLGSNLHHIPASKRFVIIIDSSSESASKTDDSSPSRSAAQIMGILTDSVFVAIVPVIEAGVSFAPVHGAGKTSISLVKEVRNKSAFLDDSDTVFAKVFRVNPFEAFKSGSSKTDGFVVSQNADNQSPQYIYQPKWDVSNDFALDDLELCRSFINNIAPPGFFSQLRNMDDDQFLSEFNVGASRHAAMNFELRVRYERALRLKRKFENKYVKSYDLVQERYAEVTSLKTQLEVREANATSLRT